MQYATFRRHQRRASTPITVSKKKNFLTSLALLRARALRNSFHSHYLAEFAAIMIIPLLMSHSKVENHQNRHTFLII